MAPCSCVEMSHLEIREVIALGVAGIQEMSMALGLDCVYCSDWTAPSEASGRTQSLPPLATNGRNNGRNGHLPLGDARRM